MSSDSRTAGNRLFKNIRVYWLAFVVYWGIVLFGYDTGIAGGVVGSSYFQKRFDLLNPDGTVNTKKNNDVSSNVVSVLQAGAFFGALGSAPVSERIGRRLTILGFTVIFIVGAILTTVANGSSQGLSEIYAGRVISGFGIGGISAVAPAYVSECAPKDVRGRITGLFQVMVAVGITISYFINYGVGLHVQANENIWRIPFGFQLVPAGIMLFGLLTVKESPRFLVSASRHQDALKNLSYLRRLPASHPAILEEMAEINAAIEEEREARKGLGLKEAFLGKGNSVRFVIAFVIFLLQQWSGQNSINYYAPQIFASIGYSGSDSRLLATGILGIVKIVSTSLFISLGIERVGRKIPLIVSSFGMGTLFFIVGALLKTHPPPTPVPGQRVNDPPAASKAMAGLIYIQGCFYATGWGPIPWVYVSDIFPTRTRHYGLALASATQWLFNFVISKTTPDMITNLKWKIFILFGTLNIGALGTFSFLLPETKGLSLEEMDIIFGAVDEETRRRDIDKQQRALDGDLNSSGSQNDDKDVKAV